MESCFKEHLGYFRCLWDKIWPQTETPHETTVATVDSKLNTYHPKADVLKALYDFDARTTDELSMCAGEELCKISDDGEYVMVRKLTGSMEVGIVPANYVTFVKQPINSNPSSEQVLITVENRLEAEKLLLNPPNISGSYLIRPSDSNAGLYSLSDDAVRNQHTASYLLHYYQCETSEVRKENRVIHFLIGKTDRGEFYLQKGRVFLTFQELINFHKTNWKLLNAPLGQPCVLPSQDPVSSNGMYTIIHGFGDVSREVDWERPHSEFKLVTKLGEGYFGEVWQGVWQTTKPVAIKTFKKEHFIQSDMEKEMNALKNLSHPNLIQLLAICSIEEPVYIVTELMTKGNLNEFLKSGEGLQLCQVEFLYITCQVAEGMAYLEAKKVIHRDLATRNILVGENLICKIADFGLARLLKDDMYSPGRNCALPVKWTAPEAITHCKFSTKSDVWSFGILTYEVYTCGKMPYEDMTNREVVEKIERGYRLPQPSTCGPEMYGLMMECWHKKADERPGFEKIVQKLYDIRQTTD